MIGPLRWSSITIIILLTSLATGWAQPASQPAPDPATPEADDAPRPVELKLTIEPAFARGIAHKWGQSLKERYELSDDQVERIESGLTRRLLAEARRSNAVTQSLLEATISSTLTGSTGWSPDDAKAFGRRVESELPAMRKTLAGFVEDVRGPLTPGQKLRFTADYAAFSIGYVDFEKRIKNWSAGKVGDNPNLFWDEPSATPTTRPDGTVESKELANARQYAKRNAEWQLNRSTYWEQYVKSATAYYGFTDAQKNAAAAVLKDCLERVKPYQTAERRRELEEINITESMCYSVNGAGSFAPFLTDLWERRREIMSPIDNLDREFKNRIQELAFAEQIAAGEKAVYEKMEKKGYKPRPGAK